MPAHGADAQGVGGRQPWCPCPWPDALPEKKKVVAELDWAIVVLHCVSLMKDAGYTECPRLCSGMRAAARRVVPNPAGVR